MTATAADPTIATVPEDSDRFDPHHIHETRQHAIELASTAIPVRYQTAVVTVPEVRAWVATLVDSGMHAARAKTAVLRTGPSLLLLGATGTGKTHEACGAIRAMAMSGVSCRWALATAADVYAQMRPRHGVDSEQVFDRYAGAQLLVLDDLGAAKGSEWTEEVNYRLINHRYERMLPTLITSNVPPRDLAAAVGERVASRLTEMAQRVVLKGADRRRAS